MGNEGHGLGQSGPQSFEPQSFEPQSFEPQSFEPQSFEPQSFEPQPYASQPYASQPYASPTQPQPGLQPFESADYPVSRVYSAPSSPHTTWAPASTERNWMGTTSVILAFLGGGALGLIFGWLGVVAARDGRATNGRTARNGLILNIVVPLVVLAISLAFIRTQTDASMSKTPWAAIAVGECVSDMAGGSLVSPTTGPKTVSCQGAHWGQVYFKATATGGTYPKGDEFKKMVSVCFSDTGTALVDPAHIGDVYPTVIVPTQESWAAGDRAIVCILSDVDNSVTGSWVVDS